MAALAAHLPLTLLLDLADPSGPDSRDIVSTEVADLSWLHDLAYPHTTTPRDERSAM
jgi:hypothetical protein